jgi:hypothetical protein
MTASCSRQSAGPLAWWLLHMMVANYMAIMASHAAMAAAAADQENQVFELCQRRGVRRHLNGLRARLLLQQ